MTEHSNVQSRSVQTAHWTLNGFSFILAWHHYQSHKRSFVSIRPEHQTLNFSELSPSYLTVVTFMFGWLIWKTIINLRKSVSYELVVLLQSFQGSCQDCIILFKPQASIKKIHHCSGKLLLGLFSNYLNFPSIGYELSYKNVLKMVKIVMKAKLLAEQQGKKMNTVGFRCTWPL